MGYQLALFSLIALGVSNWLYKRSVQVMGPTNTTFFYYLFAIWIALGTWFFLREDKEFSRSDLIWPFLIAITLFLSLYSFVCSLKYLEVSISATMRSMSFIVTIMLAVVISKEQLSPKDITASVLAVAAIIMFGLPNSDDSKSESPPKEIEPTKEVAVYQEN